MLGSVRSHRHWNARHLKPTCLHVVSKGLDAGDLDPDDIDPGAVVEGMASILIEADLPLPTRLWRPLWHLTNDGAWHFLGPSGRVGPEDFGPGRKPESLTAIGAKVDRIAIGGELRSHWLSRADRSTLRRLVLEMLDHGDENSRAVARVVADIEPGPSRNSGVAGQASRSQGRTTDLALRLAVELHAMTVVAEHLRAGGWIVEDVSAARSYDLRCSRGSEELLVEVKGTTGLGRKVQLTANEVALAQSGAPTALAIVAEIEFLRAGAEVVAQGGELRMITSWTPRVADLRPVSYQYSVPLA